LSSDADDLEAEIAELPSVLGTQPVFPDHRMAGSIDSCRGDADADDGRAGAGVLEVAGSTRSHEEMLSDKFGIGVLSPNETVSTSP
jgi:hypothetical protein